MRATFATYGFGLVAMLVPAAMQLALFAFFARVLGVQQYGLYIALMSWSPICFELAGWGAGEYLLKRTAQDRTSFPAARRHLNTALLLSLPLAALAFAALTTQATGGSISLSTILIIGIAEFTGLRLLVNAEQMLLALGQMRSANWLRAIQVAPRVAGVAMAYFMLGQQRFEALALAGSLGILAAGLAAASLVPATMRTRVGLGLSADGARQGTWFMGTQLVRAGQHNIDRVVLAPLVDPAMLGLYSAAQRFIQLGLLPLQAVLRVSYPGFFAAGRGGIGPALRHGLSVLPVALAASALATAGLLTIAPMLPMLIGSGFEQSVSYLLYMAPLTMLFAFNSTMADVLSGAGYLRLRLILTASGVSAQAATFWAWHDGIQIVLASYAGLGLSCLLTGGAALVLAMRHTGTTQPAAA